MPRNHLDYRSRLAEIEDCFDGIAFGGSTTGGPYVGEEAASTTVFVATENSWLQRVKTNNYEEGWPKKPPLCRAISSIWTAKPFCGCRDCDDMISRNQVSPKGVAMQLGEMMSRHSTHGGSLWVFSHEYTGQLNSGNEITLRSRGVSASRKAPTGSASILSGFRGSRLSSVLCYSGRLGHPSHR